MAGVTNQGFVLKTQQEIVDELVAALRARFGADINTSSASVLGQFININAGVAAELWEVALAVYNSMYPDTATGAALDAVASIIGLTRLAATRSTADLLLNLDDVTTVPAGSLVGVGAGGNEFRTLAEVSNALGYQSLIAVEAESVELGPIVANACTLDTIKTPVVGWSAKAAVLSTLSEPFAAMIIGDELDIVIEGVPLTVTFTVGGETSAADIAAVIAAETGIDAVDSGGFILAESELDGSGSSLEIVGGSANTKIGFPVGVFAGMNRLDAELGRNLETDPDFRVRREGSLQIIGAGTPEAIRARLLSDVDGVTAVLIFENDTDGTVMGRPAHSFESVILGGDDQDIFDLLWLIKPAGIQAFGSIAGVATDSQGDPQDVAFSRPTEVDIWVEVDVETDGEYPITGDAQIEAALVTHGDALGIGSDVYISKLFEPSCITGVVNITRIEIGTTAVVAGLDIDIAPTEVAAFDTSRITITATPV